MNKQELRKNIKQKRKSLDIKSISKILCSKVLKLKEYQNAKRVMIFYPLEDEVNLLELLDDESKKFYLPKIRDKELFCCVYTKGDDLCESCLKTKEPKTEVEDKNTIDLVIIPALCCDKNNYRLGYGGGFYDRFLQDFKGKKIVCLPKDLIVETIYPEKHDVPVDIIITD